MIQLAEELALGVDREAVAAEGVAAGTMIGAREEETAGVGQLRPKGVERIGCLPHGVERLLLETVLAEVAGKGRVPQHGLEALLVATVAAEATGEQSSSAGINYPEGDLNAEWVHH